MEHCPSRELIGSQTRNSPHFMETEVSLPSLQLPATCPILSQINPDHAPIPLPENVSQYYPLIYAWVFQVFLSLP